MEKTLYKYPLLSLLGAGAFIFLTIWSIFAFIEKETLITDWRMDVVGLDSTYQSGKATDIQLFLEDSAGQPITNANVQLILDRPETVHNIQKTMHHVEDGLYETEAIFSIGGKWVGIVEAKVASNVYRNQFYIDIDGNLVSEEYRDPTDHFHLEQSIINSKWTN
ncbi:FixH family protein [Bacillus sp. FJAT-45350]|uniref:FixH family protein n=1 Tax=Bacillus sp. FJAT-45350 TaxID=2011014 RepID=UPI00115523B3|nr:FixH family protein [Bacillus sp. FJAT-45350]